MSGRPLCQSRLPCSKIEKRVTYRWEGASTTGHRLHPASRSKCWKAIGSTESIGIPGLCARNIIAVAAPLHAWVYSVETIAIIARGRVFRLINIAGHRTVGFELSRRLTVEGWLLVSMSDWGARGRLIVVHFVWRLVVIHVE